MEEKTERFEMRIPASFLKTIDDWRRKQEDLPSRASAIRRLVELGLRGQAADPKANNTPRAKRSARRAAELATSAIDKRLEAVPAAQRETRKRKLVEGPSIARDVRKDQK